ncbi:hypothetical protein [Rhizobium sp. PAMB 3182]
MFDPNGVPEEKRGNAGVTLRVLLGVLFLLPGACGGLFYVAALFEWISGGFRFRGPHNFTGVFVIVAAPSILLSTVLIGLLLRYASWRRAPQASLALAIISSLVILFSVLMLYDEMGIDAPDDIIITILVTAGAIGVSVVPPFLHWRGTR